MQQYVVPTLTLGADLDTSHLYCMFPGDILRTSHTMVYVCFVGEFDPFEVFKILLIELGPILSITA
jgi:hypothetical protein